jgi:tol-pal system protein YbgF
MLMTLTRSFLTLALLAGLALPAHAQNRTDMQMFADMRMLQETVQKLQLTVNILLEQLKTTNAQVDANRTHAQKLHAEQVVQIRDIASTVSVMNEKLADSSVNVLKLTQEMSSIRSAIAMQSTLLNQILGLLQPPAAPTVPPGGGTGAEPTTPAAGGVALPSSPAAHYNEAWGYYTANKFQLAIQAYEEALQKFPDWPDAPIAQLNIGNAYYSLKRYKDSVQAFNVVITKYKDSDAVPDAYFGQGLAYEGLGQKANALKNYELIIKSYPKSDAALLAKQGVARVKGGQD